MKIDNEKLEALFYMWRNTKDLSLKNHLYMLLYAVGVELQEEES